MVPLPTRRVPLPVRILVIACLIAAAACAPAQAASFPFASPLSAGFPVADQPGVSVPAVTPAQRAAALRATTGLTPAQVAAQNVCPAPAPGQATCDAQVLVSASSRATLHPAIPAQRTFGLIVPRSGAHPFAVANSTPASPPTPTTPAYLEQAYDLSYLSMTAGGGDTVAIVDAYDDPNAEADLGVFRAQYGLPACTTTNGCFRKINQTGQAAPLPAADAGWAQEESLDLDAVSSLCPNCHILLVEANSSYLSDLSTAITTAKNLGANQISNSYGGNASSPSGEGPSGYAGVAVIASTGDHGYPGAGIDDYPASFPGFTAAGGTSLSGTSTGLRGYAESAWTLSGGWGGTSGCNTQEAKPAWQTDTGCTGRAYADVSADADPYTGLSTYDSGAGGWIQMGGTSLSSPLIAAYEAVTAVSGTSAQWAYQDAALLNDPTTGSSGSCAAAIAYICNAQTGYDGPTGAGSISGAVTAGAPGVGGPTSAAGTYTQAQTTSGATLSAGLYPNGLATTYSWQYGTTTAYGQQTATQSVAAGSAPVTASATLAGLSAQTTYHYRLVAANADGTYYGYDYTLTTNGSSPVSSAAPTISGTPTQGQALSASPGSWNPPSGETFSYQWQRSSDAVHFSPVPGATGATYTPAAADVGDELDVVVIAANAYGSGQATANAVGPVASGAPRAGATPTVSGTASTGNVLTANATWTPAGSTIAYQWQRSSDSGATWSAISGATTQSYNVAAADENDLLRVVITAGDSYGTTTATSAAVGPVSSNPPVNTAPPSIAGTSQRTSTLTATAGSWSGPGITYAYQWQSSPDGSTWTSIPGATSATHLLTPADEGLRERVLVTASNVDGLATATSGASQAISAAPPGDQTPPTVSGTAMRTYTLTAGPGTWVGPDNIYAYQWQENFGAGFYDLYGATSRTYTLSAADEGATLRVVVTATNPDASIAEASAPTATVSAALPVNTTAPSLSGTAARAATLTATQGLWSGQGNSYAFQWQRSADAGQTWTNITAATGTTYVVGAGDETDELRALITATNPDGTAQAATPATAAIPAAPPVNSTAPAVSGAATRGLPLTGNQGTWQGIANVYTEQWQRSADGGQTWTAITGATAINYVPAIADEGDELRLSITATNPDGTLTVTTAATAAVASAPPLATTAPAITGAAIRGTTLTGALGAWSGVGNAYTEQWQRSADGGQTWSDIAGATGATYLPLPADVGDEIRLTVIAANPDATVQAASPATAAVQAAAPVNTAPPTVTGTLTRSLKLTASLGTWSGLGNAYALQWQRSADGGSTWSDIGGATATTYTLASADETDRIRVAVTATNPDAVVVADSAATAPVSAAPPVVSTPPALTGSPVRGQTLSASAGSWLGIGNAYADQWQSSADNGTTWTAVSGATGLNYTLGTGDEGLEFRLQVTATNPDATVTAVSPATTTVLASPPVNSATPVISGTAQRASVLAVSQGSWTGTGNAYSYQWQRDTGSGFTAISGATSAAYTVTTADEGARLQAVVTATNADATVTATAAPTATVAAAPPAVTSAPGLTGTASRGATLSGTGGTWTGVGNSYALQWQHSADAGQTWSDIAAANSPSYTLAAADEGDEVRLTVTATNPDATVVAASAPTGAVQSSPPVNTTAPTLTGPAQRDGVLAANPGAWGGLGDTVATQWQHSSDGTHWTTIAGAAGTTYTLGVGDEGTELRVLVTASNPDGSVSLASPATGVVSAAPPVATATPTVTGTAQRASVLSASAGTWTGLDNTYSTQWQRSTDGGSTWTNVPGAGSLSYPLGVADEGAQLRVAVTASNPDATVTSVSAATAVVSAQPPANTAAPAVSGTPARGQTLVATTGSWSGAGNVYGYQWQSSSDQGQSWTNLPAATAPSYAVAVSDEGHNLRVVVSASNPDATVAAASPGTAAVQAAAPVNASAPTIAGSARVAAVLAAGPGTWVPAGPSVAYQWQAAAPGASYQNIAGATAASFTVTSAQVGQAVRVLVTATNPDGSSAAASAPTAVISAPPQVTTAPGAPTGTLMDASTLTADPGSWSAPVSFAYQWYRCAAGASAITGQCTNIATGAGYTLTGTDVGSLIGVVITATDAGGSTTVDSPLTAVIAGRPLTNLAPPSISGNPQVGNTLSAVGGRWSVPLTGETFTWQRCDAGGANCTTVATNQNLYPLTAPDAGHTIELDVAASSPGQSASAVSAPLLISAQPIPQPSVRPTISGPAARGSTLGIYPGSWTNSPTAVSYQWESCDASGQNCAAITGATALTYPLGQADEGHTITVQATATNASGSGTTTAAPTAVIAASPPAFTSAPGLSVLVDGPTPVQDGVLTTINGVVRGPAGTTLAVQWERCDSAGANCVAIAGATGSTYQLLAADVGHTIAVADTATNVDASVTSSSPASAVVAPAKPRWSTLPIIAADPGQVGDTLAITPGTWAAPAPSSDVLTVMRCTSSCVVAATLSGANPTYTIVSADAGAVLRVAETAGNASGQTSVWSSWFVGPVGSTVVAAGTLAGPSSVTLRNDRGQALAYATLARGPALAADLTPMLALRSPVPASVGAGLPALTLRLRPARGVHGRLVAWVCPVSSGHGGAPLPCTAKLTFSGSASIRLPAWMDGMADHRLAAHVPAAYRGSLRVVVKRLGR